MPNCRGSVCRVGRLAGVVRLSRRPRVRGSSSSARSFTLKSQGMAPVHRDPHEHRDVDPTPGVNRLHELRRPPNPGPSLVGVLRVPKLRRNRRALAPVAAPLPRSEKSSPIVSPSAVTRRLSSIRRSIRRRRSREANSDWARPTSSDNWSMLRPERSMDAVVVGLIDHAGPDRWGIDLSRSVVSSRLCAIRARSRRPLPHQLSLPRLRSPCPRDGRTAGSSARLGDRAIVRRPGAEHRS